MRILHTSDWHFGMSAKMISLHDDQKQFLEQLYDIIEEKNVDAVICAGDIYDSSVSNAEAISLYDEAVAKICIELKKPLIVIAGNHDSGARLAAHNDLLKRAGYFVEGKLSRDIQPVLLDDGKTAVYQIPFFNVNEVRALFPEKAAEIKNLTDAFNVVCDNIRAGMSAERFNIAVSHAYITKAQLCDSDRSVMVGTAFAVPAEVFSGFDYVALGHIHKPQAITPTIRYSGTPLKYSFGAEESHKKCVVIVDTESGAQEEVPIVQPHDRRSVSATYNEIIKMKGIENDYLKLTVTDRIMDGFLAAELRARFPFIVELRGMTAGLAKQDDKTIEAEKLAEMTDEEILRRFIEACTADYALGDAQINLFKEAAAEVAMELARSNDKGKSE